MSSIRICSSGPRPGAGDQSISPRCGPDRVTTTAGSAACSDAGHACPAAHAPAVAFGFIPALAAWGLLLIQDTLAVAAPAEAAHASDLEMTIRDAKGAAVADAVVTVETPEHKPPPAKFTQPLEVKQHNLQFEPFVLVVPVGAEVRFPNEDSVHHQVYSFSPAKTFELKLYGKDQVSFLFVWATVTGLKVFNQG